LFFPLDCPAVGNIYYRIFKELSDE